MEIFSALEITSFCDVAKFGENRKDAGPPTKMLPFLFKSVLSTKLYIIKIVFTRDFNKFFNRLKDILPNTIFFKYEHYYIYCMFIS